MRSIDPPGPVWLAIALLSVTARAAEPHQIAVIVNESDPLSVAVGAYYMSRRAIPQGNLIVVRTNAVRPTMPIEEFRALRESVLERTPAGVQFYAIAWVQPFRVECMSITSAIAFGFDPAYCANGCRRTRLSPYFASDSRRPWDDFGIRPAMSVAARDLEQAKRLIDRGVAADRLRPAGTAYLVRSGDPARDVRAAGYEDARALAADRIPVRFEVTRGLTDRDDVLFYFIGATEVPGIETNRYLPGAVADHLTSSGGVLIGGSQMSSLRWLEAGATGSYGTVVEPCNLVAKFPNPGLMMQRYLAGEALIEAYWKSVAMPGQGIFIGEPLARPFGPAAE